MPSLSDVFTGGPKRADEKFDSRDADVIGGKASQTGKSLDALDLLDRVRSQYDRTPLGIVQVLPTDVERSRALDQDELNDVIGAEVEGAAVKYQGDTRYVYFIVRSPSGRSVRAVEDYEKFPLSKKAYDEAQERTLKAARAARNAGSDQHGEDPQVARLIDEIDRLKSELKNRDKALDADKVSSAAAPEPWPGYSEMKVNEIVERLDSIEDPVDKEIAKRQIRAFGEERKSILKITEPTQLTADDRAPENADKEPSQDALAQAADPDADKK